MKKRCSRCKIEKPLSEFHRNKSRKDGLNHDCKECKNARMREAKLSKKIVDKYNATKMIEINSMKAEIKEIEKTTFWQSFKNWFI